MRLGLFCRALRAENVLFSLIEFALCLFCMENLIGINTDDRFFGVSTDDRFLGVNRDDRFFFDIDTHDRFLGVDIHDQ